MSDVMRVVRFAPGGQPVVLFDLNTSEYDGIFRKRDSFRFTPGQRRTEEATSDASYAGSWITVGGHSNASVASSFVLRGSDPSESAGRLEEFLAALDQTVVGARRAYIEWRAESLPYSSFYEIRGPAAAQPNYNNRAWLGRSMIEVEVTWPVAPLAQGHPMSVTETWDAPSDVNPASINEVRDPSFETGAITAGYSATNGTLAIVATPVNTGLASGRLRAGSAGTTELVYQGVSPLVPATRGGEAWSGSAAVRANTSGRTCRVGVRFYDAVGSVASTVWGDTFSDTAGAFTTGTVEGALAPATASRAGLVVEVQGAGASEDHFADSLMLVRGRTVPAYFDGDQDHGRWENIPHASRSIELTASTLEEWTLDQDAATVLTRSETNSNPITSGLVALGTGRTRLRHTGRGYPTRNLMVEAQFQTPASYAGGSFRIGVGKAVAPGMFIEARLEETGTTRTLVVRREVNGTETVVSTASTVPAITAGATYWIRFLMEGQAVRGELWSSESPNLGEQGAFAPAAVATPLAAGWVTITQEGFLEPGEPHVTWEPRASTARLRTVQSCPYAFVATRVPHELALQGIPGEASALADIDVHVPGQFLYYGMLGWWRRQRTNLAFNGSSTGSATSVSWRTSTTTTATVVTGATLLQQTSGGPLNDRYTQVTTTAVANQGLVYVLPKRIPRGRRHTVDLFVWTPSGTWETVLSYRLADGTSVATNLGALPAGVASGWQRLTTSFIESQPIDSLELGVRQIAATAGSVARIGGLRVFEGDADIEGSNQAQGVGAFPPFGIFLPEQTDTALGTVTYTTSTFSPTGRAAVIPASTATQSVMTWVVEPNASVLEESGDTLELEVYVFAGISHDLITSANAVRMYTSYSDLGGGASRFTSEYGSTGKAIADPGTTAGSFKRDLFRLGSLVIPVDSYLSGRGRLGLAVGTVSGGTVEIYYLLAVPVTSRASSPTAKPNDSSYPYFAAAGTNGMIKRVRSDLSSISTFLVNRSGWTTTQGLGGTPIGLPPGDSALLVNATADTPPESTTSSTISNVSTVGVAAHVTPRYRFFRPG
jgi:hypothetical protein